MLFWGWGGRSKQLELSPTQVLSFAYRYFHLFFVFSVTFSGSYSLLTLTEHGWAAAPIAQEQADEILAGRSLQPNPWRRFSLYGFLIVIALFVLVSKLRHGA
ncbi:hypothetical protein [Mycobacteroides franklinii]|uniref:Uncharacterized protein n=1 Tax=Mycobacteroides franklinii TaxID=948102 RepID=A0A4R8R8L8_9MYCO|nr:hypothetical protein [Mycobacteroides franklinii]TDZ42376.1 hypothetical protein CCUG64054_02421 [Mycobacteroides franklinii]TDZ52524.1 hypothetical protein CCUG63697_01006 [Mycobacteroides franklinii]TDZ55931.1 hypothetical protein CCUG63696_02423 [Mycobacteroides franklinii]TDZ62872.1 hypothetical protein CCUG63695_02348 [Mycobacteroides franklinii]TDZ69269.1 hypothetical protein CCUG64056_02421 [Mycobacteroides franklinii]